MVSQEMKRLGTARSVIRELFEYGNARAAQVGREHVFDFSLGNPSVPAPPQVREAAQALLAEDPAVLHGYTSAPGDGTARGMLAADLNRRFAAGARAEDLYLTAGAAAALCCVFRGLACPGDEFVTVAPYFPEYKVFIESAGAVMKTALPHPGTLQLDAAGLAAVVGPNTKAVVINSPNNPSGVVYTRESLERAAALLTEKARQYGHPIYLISDEPYREIVFAGREVPWVPHVYPDTIVCYSFSKSLSLPGERIGYVYVPAAAADHDDVYAAVSGAGRALGYVCAPSLFQRVAARCCSLTADLSVYEDNARLLTDELGAMGYRYIPPEGAFYLFLAAPDGDDLAFSRRARERDILLVPGSGFGMPGYVRLAFCVQPEMIRRSLPAFRALMDSYRA